MNEEAFAEELHIVQGIDDDKLAGLVSNLISNLAQRHDEALCLLDECARRHGFLTGSANEEFMGRVVTMLEKEGWR